MPSLMVMAYPYGRQTVPLSKKDGKSTKRKGLEGVKTTNSLGQ